MREGLLDAVADRRRFRDGIDDEFKLSILLFEGVKGIFSYSLELKGIMSSSSPSSSSSLLLSTIKWSEVVFCKREENEEKSIHLISQPESASVFSVALIFKIISVQFPNKINSCLTRGHSSFSPVHEWCSRLSLEDGQCSIKQKRMSKEKNEEIRDYRKKRDDDDVIDVSISLLFLPVWQAVSALMLLLLSSLIHSVNHWFVQRRASRKSSTGRRSEKKREKGDERHRNGQMWTDEKGNNREK